MASPRRVSGLTGQEARCAHPSWKNFANSHALSVSFTGLYAGAVPSSRSHTEISSEPRPHFKKKRYGAAHG